MEPLFRAVFKKSGLYLAIPLIAIQNTGQIQVKNTGKVRPGNASQNVLVEHGQRWSGNLEMKEKEKRKKEREGREKRERRKRRKRFKLQISLPESSFKQTETTRPLDDDAQPITHTILC